jgi:hypothetical protein
MSPLTIRATVERLAPIRMTCGAAEGAALDCRLRFHCFPGGECATRPIPEPATSAANAKIVRQQATSVVTSAIQLSTTLPVRRKSPRPRAHQHVNETRGGSMA